MLRVLTSGPATATSWVSVGVAGIWGNFELVIHKAAILGALVLMVLQIWHMVQKIRAHRRDRK